MLVIVPFYNAGLWIEKCLRSIQMQEGNKRVVVMDDASTDESGTLAKSLCQEFGFFYRKSATNQKCPRTIYDAMKEFGNEDPEEPVLIVDGDDWLPNDQVLVLLESVYKDPDIWLTYGSYLCEPPNDQHEPAAPYTIEVVRDRSYRSLNKRNLFNHPLTWRCWIFNSIPEKCFLNEEGEWFTSCYDQVIMFPMLEMSTEYNGHLHYRYLPDWLYTYNTGNPNSEVLALKRDYKEEAILSSYPALVPMVRP